MWSNGLRRLNLAVAPMWRSCRTDSRLPAGGYPWAHAQLAQGRSPRLPYLTMRTAALLEVAQHQREVDSMLLDVARSEYGQGRPEAITFLSHAHNVWAVLVPQLVARGRETSG